ncbi:ABC transporter ATP-binding protein [Skermanella stibiiresistens SB22]|uniref:ABC transporter ATP-binding protein n=1 Tax=Skermanella stibiiresistens SB22 TaxID=1385369 RepID=W9H2H7_9PROT|nr:ABC transporter ATP-binding protein [Skermanella stibiiresistens]EWY38917.1 ABC transporter ATP-binding protein [Skermanella stibiiresistens SB22]
MIQFDRVSKAYATPSGPKIILDDADIHFRRGRSVGILGVNGAGKSTLLRMIAGAEAPDTGRIIRRARLSWPLGFAGGFNGSLTGAENLRFVSRIYGADLRSIQDYVADFSELGNYLHMPIRTYSSGMKARLAFALSMAIDFDCYLVDEITGVGDRNFQAKCRDAFRERRGRSDVIMVSHSMATIREHCDSAAVLSGGKLTFHDDIDEAVAAYERQAA